MVFKMKTSDCRWVKVVNKHSIPCVEKVAKGRALLLQFLICIHIQNNKTKSQEDMPTCTFTFLVLNPGRSTRAAFLLLQKHANSDCFIASDE